MPPRPNPIAAPSNAAVIMTPGEDPPVPRDKRTEVYAMDTVQKASRTYMRVTSWDDCVTNSPTNCKNLGD